MKSFITVILVLALGTVASAATISYLGSANFTSTGQGPTIVNLASFNTNLGTLLGVTVEFTHDGSVRALADNDDPYNTGMVRAEIIREWNASGPGVVTSGAKTISDIPLLLGLDDGDGAAFDPGSPDGHDFTSVLQYATEAGVGSPFNPLAALYETVGPGLVGFTVNPTRMVNRLQWIGEAPDVWQQQVTDPKLQVNIKVTYEYVPEPSTLAFLALGVLPLIRRRVA